MIHRHKELSVSLPGQGFLTFRFNLTDTDEELFMRVEDSPEEIVPIDFNDIRSLVEGLEQVLEDINSEWVASLPKKVKRIEHKGKQTVTVYDETNLPKFTRRSIK